MRSRSRRSPGTSTTDRQGRFQTGRGRIHVLVVRIVTDHVELLRAATVRRCSCFGCGPGRLAVLRDGRRRRGLTAGLFHRSTKAGFLLKLEGLLDGGGELGIFFVVGCVWKLWQLVIFWFEQGTGVPLACHARGERSQLIGCITRSQSRYCLFSTVRPQVGIVGFLRSGCTVHAHASDQ